MKCRERLTDWKYIPRTLYNTEFNQDTQTIFTEYIDTGSLTYVISHASPGELLSIFVETAHAIIDLGYTYKITHGTLFPGNILLKRLHDHIPITKTITHNKKTYTYVDHGIIPILTDFGRANIGVYDVPQRSKIIDDILILYLMYVDRMKNEELASELRQSLGNMMMKNLYHKARMREVFDWVFKKLSRSLDHHTH